MRGEDAFAITPDILLKAYACGIFPMADSADDPNLFWVEPHERGIIPLDTFHVPRRLRRTMRSGLLEIRVDTDFDAVIGGCARRRPGRRSTWINGEIRRLFGALFRRGYVHTVEAWQEGRLVGGLYGLSLGGAFFGESMFSDVRDASKVALVSLVERLRTGGYVLLDTQFTTTHLETFGAVSVSRASYQEMLEEALQVEADFFRLDKIDQGSAEETEDEGDPAGRA
ncbi:leucyl/phenylalanyl-tRNA--protein transferase [Afifella marina]|uniref:Leucyl/phenylalanyl-tRNA--protein transferase n=1 Tax=Afifella marina DSM 2698 TaxID=1120955 RepID=A0A1G5MC87_AFIMA|nr:leucyl/phenylalanyl-tRNA--protein transferase [Afifella marina]MBK1622640.1 leucyl/phenylalanyl-tRNA--protein transferase [Afifella marina DSM 2698]MBK1625635.1 leucyl/phenylalanyl-tRNA--protein transferase [Afifella marina]MBK5917458.1 leucyl/phenylalanyl-tRNA--protein transferase [Afifella marina]RAI23402.1 leucyl/phenylalanyl-tRNA--protein transferase [Afifella marina DSM 2698]SCZ22775.1 leucyl/phenylalanyl-tRNA--protein transferase [Afifella marina DSM 2698]